MKTPIRLSAVLLLALGLTPLCGHARDVPLWEAGAGVAVLDFPDYRGSDERHTYVLPVPYVVYRGEFLKVDRENVRGLFFKTDKAELDVSLNGSVPVKSADNQARQGMPDLDPTLEIGPSLNLFLLRSEPKKIHLDLRLPVRPVIDTNAKYLGYVFQPKLNLDVRDLGGNAGWNLGLAAGPIFANQRYHQHFYGVDPAYATAARPAYAARGGYAGSQFISALSKRFPNYWVGGFVKWDTLHGSVFEDSPLVKHKQNFTAGFAVSWIFAESKTLVSEER
jgi:outer membrane scaffolding protein for murein synthesis (MipA/OmpV family)